MNDNDYLAPFTGTTFAEEPAQDTEEVIGFISFAMLDKLIAMKVAEGHDSFEALLETLLAEHEEIKKLRK